MNITNSRLLITFAASLLLASSPAWSSKISNIPGRHSATDVKGACDAAGGLFTNDPDGGYGCNKQNCDHKGGECIVACDQGGKCTGSTPGKTKPPMTVKSVLGGYLIFVPPDNQGGSGTRGLNNSGGGDNKGGGKVGGPKG